MKLKDMNAMEEYLTEPNSKKSLEALAKCMSIGSIFHCNGGIHTNCDEMLLAQTLKGQNNEIKKWKNTKQTISK